MEAAPRAETRKRRAARRLFHIAVSLAVLYYWFPARVNELGVTREELTVAGVLILAVLEGIRLWRGKVVFPMREYERRKIGGHFWLVLGCVIALLFFEQRFAMITILGTTLVDPLIGEMRGRGRERVATVAGLFAWSAVGWATVALASLETPLFLIPIGAAAAVVAERVRISHVDDNFLMNLVPLVALSLLARGFAV